MDWEPMSNESLPFIGMMLASQFGDDEAHRLIGTQQVSQPIAKVEESKPVRNVLAPRPNPLLNGLSGLPGARPTPVVLNNVPLVPVSRPNRCAPVPPNIEDLIPLEWQPIADTTPIPNPYYVNPDGSGPSRRDSSAESLNGSIKEEANGNDLEMGSGQEWVKKEFYADIPCLGSPPRTSSPVPQTVEHIEPLNVQNIQEDLEIVPSLETVPEQLEMIGVVETGSEAIIPQELEGQDWQSPDELNQSVDAVDTSSTSDGVFNWSREENGGGDVATGRVDLDTSDVSEQNQDLQMPALCLNCSKPTVIDIEWDNEFCSSICAVDHCHKVFNNWISKRNIDNQVKG